MEQLHSHPTEITITVKGEDSTYKQKFLTYDPYTVHPDDPTLQEFIKEARQNSKIEAEEVKIKIGMTL